METADKLKILTDAAKYDVACTSSGVDRKSVQGSLGNAAACGICHSFSADGRCISLLKVLFTNFCIYDCKYCVNKRTNDVARAMFEPNELAELAINFYRRNYIEGIFLSSAIIKNPDYTMELLHDTLYLIREKYKFNGYIHVKAIPGADPLLIYRTGLLSDRMSVNIELPSEESLKFLAPDKKKDDILKPMKLINNQIVQTKNELVRYRHASSFVPAGQSTQLIIGATPENDKKIITLAQGLYDKYSLKRVFYSAYTPVSSDPLLPQLDSPPKLREHRLYQADWLMRFYGFKAEELLSDNEDRQNLDLMIDPKARWAIENYHLFPLEINKADMHMLLRIPGIGMRSAEKIVRARRFKNLDYDNLIKLNVSLKRAKYFITCNGKMYIKHLTNTEAVYNRLAEKDKGFEQLTLFSDSLIGEDANA